MLLKAGVDISRLRPEIRKKLPIIASIMWACDEIELTITSTFEGTHSEGSLHYANLAVDVQNKPKSTKAFGEIRRALGTDYDVILHTSHIHIEFDPK